MIEIEEALSIFATSSYKMFIRKIKVEHQLIPITDAKRHLFKNINFVAELNELNTNLSQLK